MLRLLLALWIMGSCAVPARGAEWTARTFDWCAPVVVRPDQRSQDGNRCISRFEDEEIAAGAEVVMLGGFNDVAEPRFVHPTGLCGAPEKHADIARTVRRLHELRKRKGGPRLWVVTEHRFDLVSDTLAALPGFDADFLLRTERPWSQVMAFFELDHSGGCGAGGCRWNDSYGARDEWPGPRLRESIDAAGEPGRWQSAVYNIVRANQAGDVFSPVAVLADLRNPRYRAWRVAEAKRAMRDGGYDAITLNQKFHMYHANEPFWIGSKSAPDVATLRKNPGVAWTAPPLDYGMPEYLHGWLALAADLRAAGVPYALTGIPETPWFQRWDDPATPEPEWPQVREVMRHAALMLFDHGRWGNPAEDAQLVADLRAHGVHVVEIDVNCGLARR